jgi:hypothetical protein
MAGYVKKFLILGLILALLVPVVADASDKTSNASSDENARAIRCAVFQISQHDRKDWMSLGIAYNPTAQKDQIIARMLQGNGNSLTLLALHYAQVGTSQIVVSGSAHLILKTSEQRMTVHARMLVRYLTDGSFFFSIEGVDNNGKKVYERTGISRHPRNFFAEDKPDF